MFILDDAARFGAFPASSRCGEACVIRRRAGGGNDMDQPIARRIVVGLPTRVARWGVCRDQGRACARHHAHVVWRWNVERPRAAARVASRS